MMIKKYRKKPVIIEATKCVEGNNIYHVAAWCDGEVSEDFLEGALYITIKTLEGNMKAQLGDYIIKGIKGEFYPIKEAIFLETYEYVE